MFPNDPATIQRLGVVAARLLDGVEEWVGRRKESVDVIDETLVRRRMSVNFRLPDWVRPTHRSAGGDPVYYAPLFLLQKGSDDLPPPAAKLVEPPPHFANFDLRDQNDSAMALPLRVWNAQISLAALRSATRRAANRLGTPISPRNWPYVDRLLRYIATSERNEALSMLEELRATDAQPDFDLLKNLLDGDEALAWLLAACAVSSIAAVPLVGDAAREGLVKLSYDEQNAEFVRYARLKPLLA